VVNWLQTNTGWQLVLDNLDDISLIQSRNDATNIITSYVPSTNEDNHILITTRNRNAPWK